MPVTSRTRTNALHAISSFWTNPKRIDEILTSDEHVYMATVLRELRRHLSKSGPTVVMRLEGIVTLYVLARRAGLAALRAGLAAGSPDRSPKDSKTNAGEEVGKALEHLRKALNDFEDAIDDGEPHGAKGIADLLRPLLMETEGLADAVAIGDTSQQPASGNGRGSSYNETLASKT